MASPVNDSYSVANGVTMYVGRGAPSTGSTAPAAGYFKEVSTNVPLDVNQAGGPTTDNGWMFSNWAGVAFLPDYGAQGGLAYYGSGHLSPGAPLCALVLMYDIATDTFHASNVPAEPLLDPAPGTVLDTYNQFGESTVTATLKHPYPAHPYAATIGRSAAQGGGSQGSLIRLSIGGANVFKASAHQWDVSLPSGTPVRIMDSVGYDGMYPMACLNEAGDGFYIGNNIGPGPLREYFFVDIPSDGSLSATVPYTSHTLFGFNDYGDYALTLIPGARRCLVATGRTGSGGINSAIYVAPIVGGVVQAPVKITTTGTGPSSHASSSKSGTVWDAQHSCLVAYEAAGSYNVHHLTPPASGSLTTQPWVWTYEVMQSADGSLPCRTTAVDNGAWGRFYKVGDTYYWADSCLKKMQRWTIQGPPA
jgi:hypothetical protein